jgi:hypothetical protein
MVWENNIKMDLKGIGYKDKLVDDLIQAHVQW